jgi:pimeloyl-ACP methyl ester carboxylesterase
MMPAASSFEALLCCLGPEVRPLLKDLELYAHELVPKDYSLDTELEGLTKAADAVGFDTFHLVGYSTCLPIAFVARHPGRVRTLAMVEPGMIGHGPLAPADMVASHRERAKLPPREQMAAMARSMLAPGVSPQSPPASAEPPPPWMQQRLRVGPALVQALLDHDLDLDALHRFNRPVLVAVGSASHPSLVALARLIAETFPNGQVSIYQRRHHMDPVHRAEPERFAGDLRSLWTKGAQSAA